MRMDRWNATARYYLSLRNHSECHLYFAFIKSRVQFYELKPKFSENSYKDILGIQDFSHSKTSLAKSLFVLMGYRNIRGDLIFAYLNKITLKFKNKRQFRADSLEIIMSCLGEMYEIICLGQRPKPIHRQRHLPIYAI